MTKQEMDLQDIITIIIIKGIISIVIIVILSIPSYYSFKNYCKIQALKYKNGFEVGFLLDGPRSTTDPNILINKLLEKNKEIYNK